MTPVHVVAQPGDRRSLCGVKDPLPVVAAKWAGYRVGEVLCPECKRKNGANDG